MELSAVNNDIFFQNKYEFNQQNRVQKTNNEEHVVNDLNAIYVDTEAISKLSLKAAHSKDVLSDRMKDIENSRPLKDMNFERESKRFSKSSLESIGGDIKTSQANNITATRVMELLG